MFKYSRKGNLVNSSELIIVKKKHFVNYEYKFLHMIKHAIDGRNHKLLEDLKVEDKEGWYVVCKIDDITLLLRRKINKWNDLEG